MSTPDFAEIKPLANLSIQSIGSSRGKFVVGALALGGSLFVLGNAEPASAQVAKTSTGTKTATSKAPSKATSSTSASVKSYTVVQGDTISSISTKTGTSASAITRYNGISDPHKIWPGQKLSIPTTSGSTSASSTSSTSASKSASTPVNTKGATSSASKSASTPVSVGGSSQGQALPEAIRGTSRANLNSSFNNAAAQFGVPAELLKAIAYQESGWNNAQVSSVGAQGVGQIMPSTVEFVNKSLVKRKLDPAVAEDNIKISAAFLRYLLDSTNGNETLAVGAYYQGLGAVQKHGLYNETRTYIANVQAIRARWF